MSNVSLSSPICKGGSDSLSCLTMFMAIWLTSVSDLPSVADLAAGVPGGCNLTYATRLSSTLTLSNATLFTARSALSRTSCTVCSLTKSDSGIFLTCRKNGNLQRHVEFHLQWNKLVSAESNLEQRSWSPLIWYAGQLPLVRLGSISAQGRASVNSIGCCSAFRAFLTLGCSSCQLLWQILMVSGTCGHRT